MANYDDAFDLLQRNEGKYSNNPDDPGGETMYGVTERVARKYGFEGEMKDLPLPLAKAIAKKEYWDVAMCDQLEPRIAFQVFDTIYNGGDAIRWLQQSCNVQVDGIMGMKTIMATRCNEPAKVILRFNALRLNYYLTLKTFPKFGKGWVSRIINNMNTGAR